MVNHEIDVHADGTVTINISYRAYVETALKSLRFDALTTPALTEERKRLANQLNEMVTSGRCTEQEIKDYKNAVEGVTEGLKKRTLQSILRRLVERGKIYICEVDEGHKNDFLSQGFFNSSEKHPFIKTFKLLRI